MLVECNAHWLALASNDDDAGLVGRVHLHAKATLCTREQLSERSVEITPEEPAHSKGEEGEERLCL